MIPFIVNCKTYLSPKINSNFPLKWFVFENIIDKKECTITYSLSLKSANNLKFAIFKEKIAISIFLRK